MAEEYNPVSKATSEPGRVSILGDLYGWGGPQTVTDTPGGTTTSYGSDDWMSGISTIDPSTLTQAPGLPDFGSMNNADLQSYLGSPDFTSLLSGLSGLAGGGGSKPAAGANTTTSGGWLQNLISSLTGGAGTTGLGPYAATAGIGIYEAKQAQKDAQAKANELKGLGTPFLDQSKALLDQYKSGTLRPDQQKLVDFTSQQGQNLIQSGSALSAIAQQAFEDYRAGKLPAADEKRLQDQVTAQKQAVRQRLSSSGIVDSTILTSQDQLIDDQAMQQRQQLLDARFATGNQAYDQWLKSTEAGQALVVQGQKFASDAFESMLNDALGFGQAGMEPVASSIALAMQSDKDLSESITQLLGNLASAYAYTVAGPGNAAPSATGGAGGASGGGGGSNLLNSILGGVKSVSNIYDLAKKLLGFDGAGGQAAGVVPSGTGAPAAIDAGVANLGNVGAGQMFGSSAASALGQTGASSLNLFGAGAADLGALGAGALFGTSASAALGASAPASISLFGSGAADLSSITAGQMFGTSATGALAGTGGAAGGATGAGTAAGEALGTASGGGTAGAAAGGSGAASALGTVATGAGLAMGFIAVAQSLVHAFAGGASKTRNVETFKKALGDQLQTATVGKMGGRGGGPAAMIYNIPGKGWVTGKDLNEIAGAWYGATFAPDGDQAGWQQKLEKIWADTTPVTKDTLASRLGVDPRMLNQGQINSALGG